MGRRDAGHDVFLAISDPTRRRLLDMLILAERPVKDLAGPFRMSQPALSQHLKVLRDVGLVTSEKRGREQFYKLDPGPLLLVAGWIMRYEQFWRKKLEKLGHVLDELK